MPVNVPSAAKSKTTRCYSRFAGQVVQRGQLEPLDQSVRAQRAAGAGTVGGGGPGRAGHRQRERDGQHSDGRHGPDATRSGTNFPLDTHTHGLTAQTPVLKSRAQRRLTPTGQRARTLRRRS